jgi:hypothetical protein
MTTPEAPSPSAAPATPMNAAEIRLAETSPIDAIKAYRNRTGCTLKQAKDAFDAAPSPSPGATRDPVSCSTCTQVNLGLCPIVSGAPDAACPDAAPSPGATTPLTADLDALERLMAAAWPAPWVPRSFEIDCPCPNGDDCGDSHSCEEVEAPEAYPASPEAPAPAGDGQCVVQISVPGLESLARPTAEFIAAARNDLPAIVAELRSLRRLRADEEVDWPAAASRARTALAALSPFPSPGGEPADPEVGAIDRATAEEDRAFGRPPSRRGAGDES